MNDERRHFLPMALRIGVPEIDAQHESLFRRLASLKELCLSGNSLPAAEAEGLLAELRQHFATEEEFAGTVQMDFSRHSMRHQGMLEAVSKALNDAVEGRADIFGVLRYIEYWFERHIAQDDMPLGACLNRNAANSTRASAPAKGFLDSASP